MTYNRVTAVVLAGGRSSRMGQNKALLQLGQRTMIERVVDTLEEIFEEIIVVTDTPQVYKMLKDVKFINDRMDMEEKNSLIGLYSGLDESKNPYVFVVACDMPFLNRNVIKYMIDLLEDEDDVLIPFLDGHYQSLHAIYGKRCLPEFEKFLKSGQYKISRILEGVNVKQINKEDIIKKDPSLLCFENINTYEQYLQYKEAFG